MACPASEPQGGPEFSGRLAAARCGERAALGRLFDSVHRYLLWLASHELGEDVRAKQGASDVVQETFVRAQKGFDGFDGNTEEELKAWLRKILLNQLANTHRKYRHTAKRQLAREFPLPGGGDSAGRLAPDASAPDLTPSSLFVHNEENLELQAAIGRLPDDYQRVLTLRHWNRLSFDDIGAMMDRTANAARKLWLRAFTRLEREMGCPRDESR